jgi:type VI secretion system secreted protein Hcp
MAIADFFLKVDGIPGESNDKDHKGEIELHRWHIGAINASTDTPGVGLSAGKVQFHDLHCEMIVNKASPKLLLACAQGTGIKSAVLTCRKAGGSQQGYLKITLTQAMVTSYTTEGSEYKTEDVQEHIVPWDKVSFAFNKIEFQYKEQKADGTLGGPITMQYDISAQSGS